MHQSASHSSRRKPNFLYSLAWLHLLLAIQRGSGFTCERTKHGRQIPFKASTLSVAAAPEKGEVEALSSASGKSLSDVQTQRFHQDMQRVLESRSKTGGMGRKAAESILERRNRPETIEDDQDGVQRVLIMLDRMVQMGLATEETFQIAMRACLQRGRLRWKNFRDAPELSSVICSADQMEFLLNQLQGITNNISLETYALVLEAYATCSTPRGDRNYAEKADNLLERMQQEGVFGTPRVEHLTKDQEIPVEILSRVLHAWAWQQANLQPGECAEKAHSYLKQIEKSSEAVDPTLRMQCYDWVLEAWSKSGSDGSGKKANEVFLKLKALSATQPDSRIFNTGSYSNAILAWSKDGQPGSAQKAHDLLIELVDKFKQGSFRSSEPELIAFNAVITAWAKVGNPKKASKVLWLMEDVKSKCQNLIPDVVTYNTVLHAHVMSGNRTRALHQIQEIVNYMEDHSEDQPEIAPNSFTYNTLMKAWVRSREPDSAQQAEKILRKMEQLWQRGDDQVEPTNRHFNVVINAYAKSTDPFAARKAYDLLQRMKGGNIRSKPDIITYTTVIECFSKSADPAASEIVLQLLEEAFELHEQTGDPALRPNARTFTMVIRTLAESNGSVEVARKLLTRMIDMYLETKDEALMPNTYPYNYVLNCAANTLEDDKMQAFKIATRTYQEMRTSEYVRPDSFTYAFWFKCCNNLIKDNQELKEKCMFYAFDECRKEGLVSNTVLNRLQHGVPPAVLEEWVGVPKRKNGFWDLKTTELPEEWSRNAQ